MPVTQQKVAGFTMGLTYAAGALGIGLAFSTLYDPAPDLRWACLFAIGVAGILSFIRHALLDRGDAARMGWDNGSTNPFQIEVGLANLAWGTLALVAVIANWGLAVYSACFLVFGFYMAFVAIYKLIRVLRGEHDEWGSVMPAAVFAALLIVIGAGGMSALP